LLDKDPDESIIDDYLSEELLFYNWISCFYFWNSSKLWVAGLLISRKPLPLSAIYVLFNYCVELHDIKDDLTVL
jgi:hypothetical protein